MQTCTVMIEWISFNSYHLWNEIIVNRLISQKTWQKKTLLVSVVLTLYFQVPFHWSELKIWLVQMTLAFTEMQIHFTSPGSHHKNHKDTNYARQGDSSFIDKTDATIAPNKAVHPATLFGKRINHLQDNIVSFNGSVSTILEDYNRRAFSEARGYFKEALEHTKDTLIRQQSAPNAAIQAYSQ